MGVAVMLCVQGEGIFCSVSPVWLICPTLTLSKTLEDPKLLEVLSFLRFSRLGFMFSPEYTGDDKKYVTGRDLGDREKQATSYSV